MKKQEWLLLAALALTQFTHMVDFVIIMPLGPVLMREFEIGPQKFGLLVSAYTFAAGIAGFLAAFGLDRFERRRALLLAYAGFGLGTAACAWAPTFEWLMACRVVAGAFGGLLGSLVLALVGDSFPPERRGRAMGVVMGAFSLAAVVGLPIGLELATRFGWHTPFIALGAVSALGMALVAGFVPRRVPGAPQGRAWEAITGIFRQPGQVNALIFISVLMLGQFSIIPFFAKYLVANVGFREDQLKWVYFFGGLASIGASQLVGRWADRKGKAFVFRVMALAMLAPLLLVTHLGPTPVGLVLVVTTLFFITTMGRSVPAMALVTGTAETARRASFMSVFSCVQQLASGVAALLAGYLVREPVVGGPLTHFNWVGYVAAGTIPISLLLIGRLHQAAPPAPPAEGQPPAEALAVAK